MIRAGMLLITALLAGGTGCLEAERVDETMVRRVLNQLDGEPVVPRTANRLMIADPLNATGRDDLGGRLLPRLREAIAGDGRLGVVSPNEEKDLVLAVTITTYELQTIGFDQLGRPRLRRLRLTASIGLFDTQRNKQIFTERGLPAFREFSDQVPPIKTEDQALDETLDELARRIAAKTVTGWYTNLMSPVEKAAKDRGGAR